MADRKFSVFATTEEEYQRGKAERTYIPKEEKVGEILAPNEGIAQVRVEKLIPGTYPKHSRAVDDIPVGK